MNIILACLCLAAAAIARADEPLAPWRTNVTIRVVVADVRGTNYTVINHSPVGGGAKSWRVPHPHPIFSADGRRIYFNVNTGPWTQLHVAEQSSTP
jgi:hypothetical protein